MPAENVDARPTSAFRVCRSEADGALSASYRQTRNAALCSGPFTRDRKRFSSGATYLQAPDTPCTRPRVSGAIFSP